MRINNNKLEVKSLKELKEKFKDFKKTTFEVSTGDNDFLIVIRNKKAIQTIETYFTKSIAFKDKDNNVYVNFEGKENSETNFDSMLDDIKVDKDNISLFDLRSYFNYGTGFCYSIINNNCSFKVEELTFLNTGVNGFRGAKKKWKCKKINLAFIKDFFEIEIGSNGIFTGKENNDKQLKALNNLTWYLEHEEELHHNKVRKIIQNIIDTNTLEIEIKKAINLKMTIKEKEELFEYCNLKIEEIKMFQERRMKYRGNNNIQELENILQLKSYSKLSEEYLKRQKEIKGFFRNIDPEKIHWSGLFYNTVFNKWVPFYHPADMNEIFEELYFCKLSLEGITTDNTIYLIKDEEFYITEAEIWFQIVKHVSKKYDIELLEDTKKHILQRLEYLTTDKILQPVYKINDRAIFENGENEKFDKEKHLPFWSYNGYVKPTKEEIKEADNFMLEYVSEDQLEKLTTMLSYFLIPGSGGKKLFFIYSKQSNSGKTTFLENFAKGLFKTNANELINMGANGYIDRMNEILTIDGEFYDYNKQLSKLIKKKTGEKVLNVKTMYENSKTMYNYCKYASTTNKLPNLSGETALFDKIWVITFGEKEMKTDKNYFVNNEKKMKSLQNVIIHNVLTKKGEIIDTLLSNRNDKENDLLVEASNVILEYCNYNNKELDDIYYYEFLAWVEEFYGRKSYSKHYCKGELEVLEKLGKKVNIKKFLNESKPYVEKKIDVSQFSVKKIDTN